MHADYLDLSAWKSDNGDVDEIRWKCECCLHEINNLIEEGEIFNFVGWKSSVYNFARSEIRALKMIPVPYLRFLFVQHYLHQSDKTAMENFLPVLEMHSETLEFFDFFWILYHKHELDKEECKMNLPLLPKLEYLGVVNMSCMAQEEPEGVTLDIMDTFNLRKIFLVSY
jgi:hypothetical protein